MSIHLSLVLICSCLSGLVQALPEGRVVGGRDATQGQFPYQVSLRMYGSHLCGGSIISNNYIITAAHCVTDRLHGVIKAKWAAAFTVYVGATNRFKGGVEIGVEAIIVHPKYGREKDNLSDDLALLKLAEPLTFTKKIQPIRLRRNETQAGSNVVISGWGAMSANDTFTLPSSLQWSVLYYISMEDCLAINGIYSDSLICLAHHEADKGSCHGDSGGPASFNGELIGVCSFGVGGCGSIYPDGYTKIFYYLDWIEKNTIL